MICKHCNEELPDGSLLCTFCGEKTETNSEEIKSEEIKSKEAKIDDVKRDETNPAPAPIFNPVPPSSAPAPTFNPVPPSSAPTFNTTPPAKPATTPAPATPPAPTFNPAPAFSPVPPASTAPVAPAVPATEANPTKKEPPNNIVKYGIVGVCALLVVVLAAVVLPKMFGGGSSKNIIGNYQYFNNDGDGFYINSDGKIIEVGEEIYSSTEFLDGSGVAVLYDYDYYEGGSLGIINDDKFTEIATDVINFVISADSGTIVYVSDYDDEDETGTIYSYNVSSKKSTKIAEEAVGGDASFSSYAVSPDGKSIAYMAELDEDDEEFKGFISINGKKGTEIGKNIMCLALSNGGKVKYYIKIKDGSTLDLIAANGSQENKLVSNDNGNVLGQGLHFNADNTQLLFSHNDSTYISINGGEKQKISNDPLTVYADRYTSYSTLGTRVWHYSIDKFTDKYYTYDDVLYYMNAKLEVSRVIKDYANLLFSADGNTVVYINSKDDLKKMTNAKSEKRLDTEIAKDVYRYYLDGSADCNKIYYVTEDEEFMCATGKSKPVKIADDIYSYESNDAGECYFIYDYGKSSGVLGYTTGSKKEIVKTEDEVYAMFVLGDTVVIAIEDDDEYTLYNAKFGSRSFKELKSEVVE